MNSEKVSVLLKFKTQPGQAQALAQHLAKTTQLFEKEAGTEVWIVSIPITEADTVWLYEVYANGAAKDLHEASADYAAVRNQTNSFLAGPPQVFPLMVVGGKGMA